MSKVQRDYHIRSVKFMVSRLEWLREQLGEEFRLSLRLDLVPHIMRGTGWGLSPKVTELLELFERYRTSSGGFYGSVSHTAWASVCEKELREMDAGNYAIERMKAWIVTEWHTGLPQLVLWRAIADASKEVVYKQVREGGNGKQDELDQLHKMVENSAETIVELGRQLRDAREKETYAHHEIDRLHGVMAVHEKRILDLKRQVKAQAGGPDTPRSYSSYTSPSMEDVVRYVEALVDLAAKDNWGKGYIREHLYANSALYDLVKADAYAMYRLAEQK